MPDNGVDGTCVPNAVDREPEPGSVLARNMNLGPGQQYNHNQAGTRNTQYNAHTQIVHATTAPLAPEEKIKACQHALLTVRPEDHRAALITKKGDRVKGTCEWIRDDREYLSLLRGHTRLLWIRGGPGKGKTMLSIFLTEHLEKTQNVVYFFCRADDDQHRSSAFILRSLLWRLSMQRSEFSEQLLPHLYPPEQHEDTLSSPEALWRIFTTITSEYNLGSVICVIDGLDECDEDTQRWLATKIFHLCEASASEQAPSSMKFILVSRPENPVLKGCAFINFDPDNDNHISRDIEAFVSTRVQTLLDSLSGLGEKSREEFRARMTGEILERAEGTFLWVGFAMIELLKKRTRTQMEVAIRELPMGLPALYDRMLLQIDSRHRLICSKILRWVAFAARPMSVIELGLIINHDSSKSFAAQQLILDHLTICGSFITRTDNMVSLVHESARDYLSMAYDGNTTILKDFHMQASEVHSEIAKACLDHIAREYGRDLPIEKTDNHVRRNLTHTEEAQSFLEYATSHWPEHMRQSSQEFQQSIAISSSFFANTPVMRNRWWRAFCESQSPLHRQSFYFDDVPALHLASFLGITPWVAQLLRPKMGLLSGQRSNLQTGPSGYRPLMHATLRGHVEAVRLLLRSGVHVNAKDAKKRTALHHAVISGQVTVTQILLEYGASADMEDVQGESVLHIAAESGNLPITEQVLGRSKNIDSRCRKPQSRMSGSTALHYASRNGHVNVMQLLLDKDAELDATNSA